MTATHSTAFPTLQQPITSIEKTCIEFGRLHYISYIRNHILYCRYYIWFETYFPTVKKCVLNLQIQIKLGWALFVTYTIIQSIMRSEMCSLHLTHPSVHTWSSGQPTVQRPGSSRGLPVVAGIRTHNLGLTSGFKSNALSIRPTTAPSHYSLCSYCHVTRVGYVPSLSPKNPLLWPQGIKCLSGCYKSGTFCLMFFFEYYEFRYTAFSWYCLSPST